MSELKELVSGFRQARIAGEQLLEQGKITWDEFVFTMLGFEESIKAAGQVI